MTTAINGAWLVTVRHQAGVSRTALAAALGLSRWTLKDIELNRRACLPRVQRAYEAMA